MPRPPDQLVVVDTETTGLDPARDRVIDIGAVRLDADLQVIGSWSTLVGPGERCPCRSPRLTGITADDLADAPPFSRAYDAAARVRRRRPRRRPEHRFRPGHADAGAARCGAPSERTRAFDTLHAALLLYPDIDRHGLASMAASLDLGEPAAPSAARRPGPAALLPAPCDGRATELTGERAPPAPVGRLGAPRRAGQPWAARALPAPSVPHHLRPNRPTAGRSPRPSPPTADPAALSVRSRRLARRLRARAVPWPRATGRASPSGPARSSSPPRSPHCWPLADSACSRPAPAWARVSPICCPPPFAPPPAARG